MILYDMRKTEILIFVYGGSLICFFGLSLLAFLGDPITSTMYLFDALLFISIILGGFVSLVLYYFISEKRIREKTNAA